MAWPATHAEPDQREVSRSVDEPFVHVIAAAVPLIATTGAPRPAPTFAAVESHAPVVTLYRLAKMVPVVRVAGLRHATTALPPASTASAAPMAVEATAPAFVVEPRTAGVDHVF